jgi:hypothetical protein
MNASSLLPVIEPNDSSDTRWALETARTLWDQGERREALQWVRRAAEAAAESGADDRALVLAKMGAELRTTLEIPRTLPPPPPVAPQVPVQMPPPASRRISTAADSELVVTVIASDGAAPAPDPALVSHRAVRVAVMAVASDASELRVRRLAPGEVAPKDSTVALLVAFEPGASPVPERE